MSKVITHNGEIINVGPWDYQLTTDEDGTQVINNPIPDGAIEEDVEYTLDARGRIRKVDDYHHLRKAEYPSIGDQLDALFAAGLYPAEMAAKIQEIKDKYPKPE